MPTVESKAMPTTPSAPSNTTTSTLVVPLSATPAETPVVTSALTSIPISQDSAGTDDLVSGGLEVYRQQYCGICHQLSAAETAGKFGPAHDAMGAVAEQRLEARGYNGRATTPGEYIYESIMDPKAYVVPGYEVTSHHMPAYAHLEQGDLEALVQMLLQQR
jgi:mono/diheme cytochrome c family protein